jgi:hypothetical protein
MQGSAGTVCMLCLPCRFMQALQSKLVLHRVTICRPAGLRQQAGKGLVRATVHSTWS